MLSYAVAALGPSDARTFIALLNSPNYQLGVPVGFPDHVEYPYRYPALDAVLNKAAPASFASGATALGAAFTVLGGGPVAYSVLNRARAAGGCAPQLDLLLLLAADEDTSSDILRAEEQRTESACPHDPTPGWLVGQSVKGHRDFPVGGQLISLRADRLCPC